MRKAKEFIGKTIDGQEVSAVAGYYLQPDGGYRVKKTVRPWMKYWDHYDRMNEAFGKIMGLDPRLKETPFVFGGKIAGMTRVYPEDFDPSPGCFLKPDLETKIEKSSKLLSDEYLAQGDKRGSEGALNNIVIAKTDAVPKYDLFQRLCELQKRWHDLMPLISQEEIRSQMRDIVLGNPQ
jgi:hypothetical protein